MLSLEDISIRIYTCLTRFPCWCYKSFQCYHIAA